MAEENNINKSDIGDQSNNEFVSDNNRTEEVEEGPHFHGNEPDIGLGNINLNSVIDENANAESKSARKEDVVVSFKHFLNNLESNRSNRTTNSSNNSDIRNILDRNNFAVGNSVSYSVSNPVTTSASTIASSNTYRNPFSVVDSNVAPSLPDVSSDISSALPDFVQDHLAMEQHYFNRNHSAPNFPMNSFLPDFASYAPVCPNDDVDRLNNKTSPDSSSDLPATSRNAPLSVERADRSALNGVFRLDNYPSNSDQVAARTTNANPLDLPPSHSIPNECVNRQPCRPISRMPDFLADSHVYGYVSSRLIDSSAADPGDLCELPQSNNSEQLRIENEILRKRVEDLRESLAEQTRRLAQAESLLSRTTNTVCPNCQRGDTSSVQSSSSTVEHYSRRSVPSGSKYFTVSPPSELTESVKDAIELAKQLINRLYDARSASRNLHIPDDVVVSKKPENDRSDDDSE